MGRPSARGVLKRQQERPPKDDPVVFVIRREQMDALSKSMEQNFEKRMVNHISEFFPDQVGKLGNTGVLKTIRYGIRKAASYGIDKECDVCKYIDLMIVFGRDFDANPAYEEAKRVLTSPKDTAKTKMRKLYKLFNDLPTETNEVY
jgi:hypothetical protein